MYHYVGLYKCKTAKCKTTQWRQEKWSLEVGFEHSFL